MKKYTPLIMTFLILLSGILVLILIPDYRVEKNLTSNRDYYPKVVSDEKKPVEQDSALANEDNEAVVLKDLLQKD